MKYSSDIRHTHLEEMTIDTDLNLPPAMSKPYPLLLKHHKFVKEEIGHLLEVGLIEISMSPYSTPIIVVPRKSKPGDPLTETERLVIDYGELNQQIPKVQTSQAKSKGRLALIETAKIDHIWSKLKGTRYLSILEIWSGHQHISIHPDSRPKATFTYPYRKFQWKRGAFGVQQYYKLFLNLMFKISFKYLYHFLVFWMHDLLIYSQTKEELLNTYK